MKTLRTLTHVSTAVLLTALALSVQAGSLINNFDNPFDYVANGIIGDTNWDGVYLRFGDVPGGNPGTDGNGNTLVAGTAAGPLSGFLALQNANGNWAGAADDGFFIYKVVQGDFDMSVESVPGTLNGGSGFDTRGNNFAGLMVRAYNTNNSGGPVSFTQTNAAENFLLNWRFQEFGLNQVRQATNNADPQSWNYPDSNSDTNTTRYFRITRVGDAFFFYWKTNQPDAWVLITNSALFPSGSIARPDWNGKAVQVGIAHAGFNSGTASRDALFDDFELSGPNVTFPPLPAGAPSSLVTTATNTGGSLKFSWTVGDPVHDRSLVIVRANGIIEASPIQGIVYNANAAYGDTNTAVAAAREFVVFNGTGNSVTVTNLAGTNTVYTVAVYEYSNAVAPVYNTASPAVNSFLGPGIVSGVIASIGPTNLPVGGAALGNLFATFSSGGGTVDESAVASWVSSDPTIAAFNGSTLSALATGTVTVTGSFAGFNATQVINVHAPAFVDNFGTFQDYIANGVQGSTWDGLFLNYGDVPLTTAVDGRKGNDNAAGQAFQCVANTNSLFIDAAGSTWAVAGNDGPFLYKIVTGDFQASIHIGVSSTINANDNGIMARLFNNSSTALQGGGGGTGGTETHINWVKIQNGQIAMRATVDSGGTTVVNGLNATDRWLLMQRVNSTNFLLFEGATGTNWQFATSFTLAEAANNAPMEVGLEQEMRATTEGFGLYDTLMIDGPGITPPATPPPAARNLQVTLNADLSMTFSWVASDNAGNPIRSGLIMRAGGPITAFPTLAQAGAIGGTGTPVSFGSSGVNVGDGNWLTFATANPASSTNVTCTVNSLSPGVIYYAAVVTFTGSGATKAFNNVLPASGATANEQDGALLGMTLVPPPPIPVGGIGIPQALLSVQGGAIVDASAFTTFTPSNAAVVTGLNGVLTGVSNGTTLVTAVYKNFTNVFSATVRPPTFTDNFGVSHDYLANGVTGTAWGGVYRQGVGTNEVPDSEFVPAVGTGTTVADANISSNNVLTITAAGDGWEENNTGGFFLFNYAPGDFQAAVHITSADVLAYNQPGLLARAYSTGTNGTTLGAPFVIGTLRTNASDQSGTVIVNVFGESWVSLTRFDEFNIGTYVRLDQDSAVHQSTQNDQGDGNFWLLIYRSNGTNFQFFMKANATDSWKPVPNRTVLHVSQFAGAPMQVGLMSGPWSGANLNSVLYDHFMFDRTTGSPLTITRSGSNVILSWPPIPATLWSRTNLVLGTWQQVGGTPALGPNGYSQTLPRGAAPTFFRLVQ